MASKLYKNHKLWAGFGPWILVQWPLVYAAVKKAEPVIITEDSDCPMDRELDGKGAEKVFTL